VEVAEALEIAAQAQVVLVVEVLVVTLDVCLAVMELPI
jgi:hypothetical protein